LVREEYSIRIILFDFFPKGVEKPSRDGVGLVSDLLRIVCLIPNEGITEEDVRPIQSVIETIRSEYPTINFGFWFGHLENLPPARHVDQRVEALRRQITPHHLLGRKPKQKRPLMIGSWYVFRKSL
jgi:hypothetical protein